MCSLRPALGLLLVIAACGSGDGGGQSDAAPADAAVRDGGGGAGDATEPDATAATCDESRTRVLPGDMQIEVGDLCDAIEACVADLDQAAALMEVAPDYTCQPGPGYRCQSGEVACSRDGSGEVTQEDYDQICAITVLPTPPDEVVCLNFQG